VERDEVTYLDLHVVVWLFGGEAQRLSNAVVAQIQGKEGIGISRGGSSVISLEKSDNAARRSHDCERGTHECVRHGASAAIVK